MECVCNGAFGSVTVRIPLLVNESIPGPALRMTTKPLMVPLLMSWLAANGGVVEISMALLGKMPFTVAPGCTVTVKPLTGPVE